MSVIEENANAIKVLTSIQQETKPPFHGRPLSRLKDRLTTEGYLTTSGKLSAKGKKVLNGSHPPETSEKPQEAPRKAKAPKAKQTPKAKEKPALKLPEGAEPVRLEDLTVGYIVAETGVVTLFELRDAKGTPIGSALSKERAVKRILEYHRDHPTAN